MSKPSPARYRTTNWSSYTASLRKRGSLLIWLDKDGSWLARMIACKSRMLTAIALANKLARIIWAIMTRKDVYRDPAGAVC